MSGRITARAAEGSTTGFFILLDSVSWKLSLKIESHHGDKIVITGGTASCSVSAKWIS